MKILILTTLFLTGGLFTGHAYRVSDSDQTISSDGSYADTKNALAYVAGKGQDGWVLTVGSAGGAYTWTNQLIIGITNQFIIQGASPVTPPIVTSSFSGGFGIILSCIPNKPVTVKDFIFNEWSAVNGLFLVLGNGLDCFRLTNLKFNHNNGTGACAWIGSTGVAVGEGPYGLIDHCEINSVYSGYGFYIRDTDRSWQNPMTLGTRKAVYIEDCSFHAVTLVAGSPAVDSDNGGRFVMRYCSLTNFSAGTHGPDSGGPTNSVLQYEVMHNTWCVSGNQGLAFCFFVRGGTGVMFSNTITRLDTSEYNHALYMEYYRGLPGGNGVCVQDRFYPADYPATQQPGMGVSPGATGQDPNYRSMPWVSLPIYYWGNAVSAPMNFGEVGATPGDLIANNRDYFVNVAKPDYTEYTYPHPLAAGTGGATNSTTPTDGGSTNPVPTTTLSPPSGLNVFRH